jgi:DNA-binding transcriptional LysR family regulator
MIALQRLEGFFWVARLQSYAKAARAFPYPITQPGVHQQVSRLEAQLGVRLFERAGKDRMILTPSGRILYEAIAPFFEKLAAVEEAIRTGSIRGTLRLDSSGHLLRYLLPPWLRSVQGRHPDVRLELTEVKEPDLERLRSGVTDLLVEHLPRVPSDLRAAKIALARGFLVVSAHHPAVRGKQSALRLEDWRDETFISYGADRHSRELQLRALQSHGITPKRICTADSSETILGFVAAGMGYSLVPSVLPNGPREVGVFSSPLSRPSAEFPIYAVWRKSAGKEPLLKAALELAPKT